MSQRTIKRIHLIYGSCLSVFIIIAALNLILSCYAIYSGEASGFSREIVTEQFSKIAISIYICLAGILAGVILSICLPVERNSDGKENIKNLKAHPNYFMAREKLAQKVDLEVCDSGLAKRIKRERRKRSIYTYVCIILCVVAAIPLLIFICNPNNYDKYLINQSIIPAVILALVWCVLAFIYCLVLSIITRASLKAEIAYLKDAICAKTGVVVTQAVPANTKKETLIMWSVRGVILAVAVVFIVVGIFNGGMADVLGKAIRLCTECIGLG